MKSNVTILLLLVSIFGAANAMAADKTRKEAAFGKGGGPLLTRDQLRACLSQTARLTRLESELANEQTALTSTKEEIALSGVTLKAALESLDRTNAEAVASYNEQAQTRDRQIDDYERRVDAFNGRVQSESADRDAHNKGCQNRRYFEDDEVAIKKAQ